MGLEIVLLLIPHLEDMAAHALKGWLRVKNVHPYRVSSGSSTELHVNNSFEAIKESGRRMLGISIPSNEYVGLRVGFSRRGEKALNPHTYNRLG